MKIIGKQTFLGHQGVNLIEQRFQSMGYWWYPSTIPECGIDGHCELRDPVTGEMTNLIVQVQSKATEVAWSSETASGFTYICREEDLQYWLRGNAPVIIVFSRPKTDEAYWVPVKQFFASHPELRESRKIIIDKGADRFDASAAGPLFRLARPKDGGIYLSPRPKEEKLYSNLVKVSSYAPKIYVAQTAIRDFQEIWDGARELEVEIGAEWVLSDGDLISFHDLSQYPWSTFCDRGTLETFSTSEWADGDDADKRRQFMWLLGNALRERLKEWNVWKRKEDKAYYFGLGRDKRDRRIDFSGSISEQYRTVVKRYSFGKGHYFRHLAFYASFKQVNADWYVSINPSYVFTTNGSKTSRYEPDLLSGIKRKEHNDAVIVQVHLWTDVLTRSADLVHREYPFLNFSELATFSLPYGIDDKEWLAREEVDIGAEGLEALTKLPLFP